MELEYYKIDDCMVSRKQERNYNRDIKLRTIGVLDWLQSESSFEDIILIKYL